MNIDQIRYTIREEAGNAIRYGNVDKAWVNSWLAKLGIEPYSGGNTYRLNIPITAVFGASLQAANRAEAKEKFLSLFNHTLAAGQINEGAYCQHAYQVQAVPGAEVTFYAGPEDVVLDTDPKTLTSVEVIDLLWEMLKEGVTGKGWNWGYANRLLSNVGSNKSLPKLEWVTATVLVAGTAKVNVMVFEGASDEDRKAAVTRFASSAESLRVKPEEVSWPPVIDKGEWLAMDDEDEPF